MFKIDWPCAVGGVVLGYYTKGKVENTKKKFCGIYTKAIENLKESFSEDYQDSQSTQNAQAGNGQNAQTGNGQKNG